MLKGEKSDGEVEYGKSETEHLWLPLKNDHILLHVPMWFGTMTLMTTWVVDWILDVRCTIDPSIWISVLVLRMLNYHGSALRKRYWPSGPMASNELERCCLYGPQVHRLERIEN